MCGLHTNEIRERERWTYEKILVAGVRASLPEETKWRLIQEVFVKSSDPWWRRRRRSKAVEIDGVEWQRKLNSAEMEAIEMTAETEASANERIECEMKILGVRFRLIGKIWVWETKFWGRWELIEYVGIGEWIENRDMHRVWEKRERGVRRLGVS